MMSDYPKVLPSFAFGPLGRPRDEELRFWRLIEEREREEDGSERVVLACGHTSTFIVGIPDTQEYAYCPQCVHEWTEAHSRLECGHE
jgi:hypothetical protein